MIMAYTKKSESEDYCKIILWCKPEDQKCTGSDFVETKAERHQNVY
jgi:hypothetical protein